MRCFTMLAFIILTLPVFAQKENKFRVEYDGRPYLVMHASETPIILPTKRCYEQIDPDLYTIEHSKNFLIVRIYDEMQNGRGILLFDTTGKQINFDKVTAV